MENFRVTPMTSLYTLYNVIKALATDHNNSKTHTAAKAWQNGGRKLTCTWLLLGRRVDASCFNNATGAHSKRQQRHTAAQWTFAAVRRCFYITAK